MSRLTHAVIAMFLVPLTVSAAEPVRVEIDAGKKAEAISPLIYGQFIEHLGRCIYGGIWAEMLEDRKFYFPITETYASYKALQESRFPVVGASPWEILGPTAGVTMQTTDVYVGEHVPRIAAGSGIRQNDLGVVADAGYVGYVIAKPVGANAKAEIEVSLVWGDAPEARASTKLTFIGSGYAKQPFSFTAKATTEHASLELRVISGDILMGPPSLMPADNVQGMRQDTLALLKRLNATVYRWPGGNFVSGYDWRDGIGNRDRRPPRKNPAWTGVEHNDFGTDEFIAFCRTLGTEPMIAVNTGFGDDFSAAQWVEYCNRPADTLAGKWRAINGNVEPYGVKYWCVGNEMWGPFQLGWMQLAHYVQKHNRVATALRKVDPKAVLVGVGDIDQINVGYDPDQVRRGIPWSQGMLESCGDRMDMISEHFYAGRVPWWDANNRNSYHNGERIELLPHVRQVKDAIRHRADKHRALQPTLPQLEGRIIPISMDEWNYWHREYAYGELGCIYELQDGLGIAEGYHEFFRNTDIIKAATYAQTVNVIGAIKTTKTAAEMETTGLVLELYRAHFGQIPLVVPDAFDPLDISAALTADGRTLTVGVVNPTRAAVSVALAPKGLTLAGQATRWHITGPNEFAHNAPGEPRVVDIAQTDGVDAAKPLEIPALSCAVFEIPLK